MEDALVSTYRTVLDALAEASVPENLREVAFQEGMVFVRAARMTPPGVGPTAADLPDRGEFAAEDDPLTRIAGRLEVDLETVREVFHDDQGDLGIGVAPSRLLRRQAAATKQIALLLAAGRQAGGYDEGYTHVRLIREMCRDFGRLDASNFSSTITEMSEEFTFKGRGQDRQVHVTRPGWVKARELVNSLTEGA